MIEADDIADLHGRAVMARGMSPVPVSSKTKAKTTTTKTV